MLETVIQYGTGKAAAIGQFAAGKTGTTSNFGDAWFVGWDAKYTVAVWVGYPDKLVPMEHDFNGQPVMGGTYPALIWHDFMTSALQIDKTRAEEAAAKRKVKGGAGEPKRGSSSEEETTSTPSSGEAAAGTPAAARARTPRSPHRPQARARANPRPRAAAKGRPDLRRRPKKRPRRPPRPTKHRRRANRSAPSPSPTGGVSPNG